MLSSSNFASPSKSYVESVNFSLQGGEIWALRKAEQNLVERTEMRMLRWVSDGNKKNIRNEEIRARTGVANISGKIKRSETEMVSRFTG